MYLCCVGRQIKNLEMKATKKQITEVIIEATSRNLNIERVLIELGKCSISEYKAFGANGLCNAFEKMNYRTKEIVKSAIEGGVSFNLCTVITVSEKAFLLSIPVDNGFKVVEKWIAKSIIKNDTIPFWAVK